MLRNQKVLKGNVSREDVVNREPWSSNHSMSKPADIYSSNAHSGIVVTFGGTYNTVTVKVTVISSREPKV